MTRRPLATWLLLVLACGAARAASPEPVPPAMPPLRVLFIGNSYTYVNDLPVMFARLAAAGGVRTEISMTAQGGWTLADHAASAQTLQTIRLRRWHYVVLQEQSEVPAIERERAGRMAPAVRALVREIADFGGAALLFVTWGHRDGLPAEGLSTFEAMQGKLTEAYSGIAKELRIGVAPVGAAWLEARTRHPEINLWQGDGSHPSAQGSYLAACVFYATMLQRSPVGSSFSAGLPAGEARALEAIAADVVLKGRPR